MSDTNTPIPTPSLSMKKVVQILGHDARWHILRELSKGQALPVSELGRRIGMRRNAVSKHVRILRRMGILEKGFGSLYTLTPAYRPAPSTATLDLGHCVVRLDTPAS